jgi:integrase
MARAKTRRRGHIRQRGKSWVVTFRLNGRQHWSSFKTREAAELYLAEWQPKLIRQEEAEEAPERVTFGEAALEWLRHAEHERAVKPSTLRDYRSALECHFIGTAAEPGWLRGVPLERISARTIEEWRSAALRSGMSRRNAVKLTSVLHGVFERARRAYRFRGNPIDDVDPLEASYSGRFDFYSPEEVWALVRAAKDEPDGAIYLTAAFTGLRRGELLALR